MHLTKNETRKSRKIHLSTPSGRDSVEVYEKCLRLSYLSYPTTIPTPAPFSISLRFYRHRRMNKNARFKLNVNIINCPPFRGRAKWIFHSLRRRWKCIHAWIMMKFISERLMQKEEIWVLEEKIWNQPRDINVTLIRVSNLSHSTRQTHLHALSYHHNSYCKYHSANFQTASPELKSLSHRSLCLST